jgi:membrane-associated phospholipid phosphatase
VDRIDVAIIAWVNQFAQRSHLFDASIRDLAFFSLLKGTPFVLVLTWMWCSGGESQRRRRQVVIATICAAACAVALGRLMANGLPFRPRPLLRTDIHFVLPYTVDPNSYRGWSAFPSDTAMLYAALATGFWFVSPRLALMAHAYGAVVIGFPRLYVGFHHPSDLIVGAAIGTVVSVVANGDGIRKVLAAWPLRLAEKRPTIFALLAMLMATQLASTFDDVHTALRGMVRMASAGWCGVVGGKGCSDAPPTPGSPNRELRASSGAGRADPR